MISGEQFLKELRSTQPHLALLLQNIIDGVNSTATQLGVDPKGRVSSPAPPEALNVIASNGSVHAVITHNAAVNKGVRYFVEADTNPAFQQPHVFDLGTSRSLFTSLPNAKTGGGTTPWHFRAYAQYNGSDATEKIYFGSKVNPTPVTVGGITTFTPFPSTGSGTAAANGQQGGQGLGVVLNRPVPQI